MEISNKTKLILFTTKKNKKNSMERKKHPFLMFRSVPIILQLFQLFFKNQPSLQLLQLSGHPALYAYH